MAKKDGMTQPELESFGWAMEKTLALSQSINNQYQSMLESEVAKRRASMERVSELLYLLQDEVAYNSDAGFLVREAIHHIANWNEENHG